MVRRLFWGFFGGSFENLAFPLATLGLEFAKLPECPFELAREARAMEAEHGKGLEGWLRIRVMPVPIGHPQEAGFEERDAAQAPGGFGEFLHQMVLGGRGRLEFLEELAGVQVERGAIFRGQDRGTGGQSVAERIERRTLFPGFGAGSGGVLGVGAIDGRAVEGGC